jgi:BirA family biotin operon repressor/biotin-[acetyl-CoA-carboxylase] ligase
VGVVRGEILQMLREEAGRYVSGEEASRRLNVSRTAIWKHIRALRQDGYDIEAHPRLGYRLCRAPDLLLPAEIKARLTTKKMGRAIAYFRRVESTNNEAKALAAAGCPEGQIVVAEEQSVGRGRLSRGWFSPFARGVWFTIVLRPPFSPQEAPKCTLLAAVAVCRAIRRATGVACGIKWPNDILYDGRKLVGILTEMSAEMDAINHIVIGIGINVNIGADDFPPELRGLATSLSLAAGRPFSRLELFLAVLAELERVYGQAVTDGFATVLDEWRGESVTLGRTVDVIGPGRRFSGKALDIDADGALLVQTDGGMERVLAGDVSIRTPERGAK